MQITKFILMAVLLLPVCSTGSLAESFLLEPAGSVLARGRLETGIVDGYYSYRKTETANQSVTVTETSFPLYLRCGASENVEFALWAPRIERETVTEDTSVSPSVKTTGQLNGMGNAGLLVKYILGNVASLGVKATLPIGIEEFRKGTDISPFFSYKNLLGGNNLNINLNLGFTYTGEYTSGTDKINPQDVVYIGAGIEYIRNKNWTLICEIIYNNLSTQQITNGISLDESTGATSDIIAGVRMKYGSLKGKLGVAIPYGKKELRDYDYRVIFGLSYILGIFAM